MIPSKTSRCMSHSSRPEIGIVLQIDLREVDFDFANCKRLVELSRILGEEILKKIIELRSRYDPSYQRCVSEWLELEGLH